jgi:hypothetical protein
MKKLIKKRLEARISIVERDNAVLKKMVDEMNFRMSSIEAGCPKYLDTIKNTSDEYDECFGKES